MPVAPAEPRGRSTDLEGFRADALAFLEAHASRARSAEPTWGSGDDAVGFYARRSPEEEAVEVAAERAWRARQFDEGFGWISGPCEYAGRGLPLEFDLVYRALRAEFAVPSERHLALGLGMVGPTILAHGHPEVRERYLRAIYRGDVLACQLFSEPNAGSDLASLTTRAIRAGDDWIVSGQKVWSSGAQRSDIGEILCRTADEGSRHRGVTAFVIDMRAPGVEVRPIRQMTGGSHFNEVFLDGARIPDTYRLGEVNDGWRVAMTTLMNERATLGAGSDDGPQLTRRLIATAQHLGRNHDPVMRQRLADLFIHVTVARLTNQRALARLTPGESPGPGFSVARLTRTQNVARMCAVASDLLGVSAIADSGEWGTYCWENFIVASPASRIAGGTDEVQRNVLAERVLGLPR